MLATWVRRGMAGTVHKQRKITGLSEDKYRQQAMEQQEMFGAPSTIATGPGFVHELGNLLHDVEVKRAATIKKMSLWPCKWVNGQCTGEPLQLFRCQREMKHDQPNPEYGRFYVALMEPKLGPDGTQLVDANGRAETVPTGFTWFDQTPYVMSNCFGWTWSDNPLLIRLLTKTYGPGLKSADLWPGAKQMATLWTNVCARHAQPFEVAEQEGENNAVAQPVPANGQSLNPEQLNELVGQVTNG